MEEIGIPPKRPVFIGGYAARKATLSETSETYPLIIMSHGTGGAGMQMMWLCRELAAQGYIVAAID
ncbi:MAG: peptidase, partial [Litorimonas sp.]